MGTRADFYVGRGEKAEWLGSIAWDGHPESIDEDILGAKTAEVFRDAVLHCIAHRKDGTAPDMGWPWPWEDSRTTDYAYAFDEGKVWGSSFGREWFDTAKGEPEDCDGAKVAVFPNMKHRQRVTVGDRSGVILLGIK